MCFHVFFDVNLLYSVNVPCATNLLYFLKKQAILFVLYYYVSLVWATILYYLHLFFNYCSPEVRSVKYKSPDYLKLILIILCITLFPRSIMQILDLHWFMRVSKPMCSIDEALWFLRGAAHRSWDSVPGPHGCAIWGVKYLRSVTMCNNIL